MKHHTMQFSPVLCSCIPLRYNYSPQHPVHKYLHSSLNVRAQVQYLNKRQNYTFTYFFILILIFTLLGRDGKADDYEMNGSKNP